MPCKVLIFIANPTDSGRLRLPAEVREIQACHARSPQREEYAIDPILAARPADLRREILAKRPDVVHFSGHGTGAQGLMLEDDQGGTRLVPADVLADLFKLFEGQVRCVVLNACFSTVQAEVIARHVPYVIGMSSAVGDADAAIFSAGFYEALFSGESVERAFEFGRVAIRLESLPATIQSGGRDRNLVPAEADPVEVLPEHLKPRLIRGGASAAGGPTPQADRPGRSAVPPAPDGGSAAANANQIVLRLLGTNLLFIPPAQWTSLTVGRQKRKPGVPHDQGNDFVIRTKDEAQTQGISRRHFELHRTDGVIHIVDRSKKGTAVNGARLEKDRPHPLEPGDRIDVGGALTLEVGIKPGTCVATNQSIQNVELNDGSVVLEITTGDLATE